MCRLSRFVGMSTLILAVGQYASSQQVNSQQPVTNSASPVIGSQTPLPTPLPLATPPAIALPGSGVPAGGPVQVGVNDPRNGSGYVQQQGVAIPESYVVTPAMVAIPGSGTNVAQSAAPSSPVANAPATQNSGGQHTAMQTGIGSFTADNSRMASRSNGGATLADIASQLKARKGSARSRQFTNKDIYASKARLSGFGGFDANSESMPQSDVSGNGNTTSQGVLDQRDLNAVNAALARSQAKQAAKQKEQSNQQQDSATNPKF
jgi:hypothetical protein